MVTLSVSTKENPDKIRDVPISTSDFQCSICGAIFTTDEDRKQHLQKESLGELLASSDEEKEIAKSQEAINDSRRHYF